jgi:Na+-driven multidrug efflux pump
VFLYESEYFIRLFVDDLEVIGFGTKALQVISLGYICYAFGMVMPQAFNGAGDTVTPTWINFFSFWLVQIPCAYTMAIILGWAEDGVYFSIVIGESILAILGIVLFRRGKWKLKEV